MIRNASSLVGENLSGLLSSASIDVWFDMRAMRLACSLALSNYRMFSVTIRISTPSSSASCAGSRANVPSGTLAPCASWRTKLAGTAGAPAGAGACGARACGARACGARACGARSGCAFGQDGVGGSASRAAGYSIVAFDGGGAAHAPLGSVDTQTGRRGVGIAG